MRINMGGGSFFNKETGGKERILEGELKRKEVDVKKHKKKNHF